MSGNVAKPYGLKAADITAAASKATPVDADSVSLVDSEASNALKRLTWANLKAAIRAWFIGLSNTWGKTQVAAYTTVSYSATITDLADPDTPHVQRLSLTGDTTITVDDTDSIEGQTRLWQIDDTGGNTITWSGVTGTAPDVNADDLTEIELLYFGGEWRHR